MFYTLVSSYTQYQCVKWQHIYARHQCVKRPPSSQNYVLHTILSIVCSYTFNHFFLIFYVFELSSGYLVKAGDHTITYTGEPMTWEKFGFKVYLPKDALPPDIEECKVHFKASPFGYFHFPENSELVSGLYQIDCSSKFEKPVEVEVQHCAAKRDLYHTLKFVETAQPVKPHYQFEILNGGSFHPSNLYGSIQLQLPNSFVVGVVSKHHSTDHRSCQPESLRRYSTRLYYSSGGIHTWNVYLVIMWKLDLLIAVSTGLILECQLPKYKLP